MSRRKKKHMREDQELCPAHEDEGGRLRVRTVQSSVPLRMRFEPGLETYGGLVSPVDQVRSLHR